MTVGIAHLRALHERSIKLGRPSQRHHVGSAAALKEWMDAIDDAAPALFDEVEAARAEVERLRARLDAEDTQTLIEHGRKTERAAIVTWLREDPSPISWSNADAIERGDHLAEEPQP